MKIFLKIKNLPIKYYFWLGGFLIISLLGFLIIRLIINNSGLKETDQLIKLVPADAVAYSHFYFDSRNPSEEQLITDLFDDLESWSELTGPGLKEKILPRLDHELALALIPDQNQNLRPLLLFKLDSKIPLEAVEPNNYFFDPGRSVLLITKPKIKEIEFREDRTKSSLVPKQSFDLNNYFPLNSKHFNQSFVNLDWLDKRWLKSSQTVPEKILAAFLEKQGLKKLLLRAEEVNNHLMFNFITWPSLLPDEIWSAPVDPLIKSLPPNSLLYFRGNSTPESNKLIGNFLLSYLGQDLNSKLWPLFGDQPKEFLLTKNADKNLSYLLATPAGLDSDSKIKNLRTDLSQYLTLALPREQEKILPDQTKVTELLAQPDRFQFRPIIAADQNGLAELRAPEINLDLILGSYQNKIIFSNSLDLVQKITKSPTSNFISLDDLAQSCDLNLVSRGLLFLSPELIPDLKINSLNYFKIFEGFILAFEEPYFKACFK